MADEPQAVLPPPWPDISAKLDSDGVDAETKRHYLQTWAQQSTAYANQVPDTATRTKIYDVVDQQYANHDKFNTGATLVNAAKSLPGAVASAGLAAASPFDALLSGIEHSGDVANENLRRAGLGPKESTPPSNNFGAISSVTTNNLAQDVQGLTQQGAYPAGQRSEVDGAFSDLQQNINKGTVTPHFIKQFSQRVKLAAANANGEDASLYDQPDRNPESPQNLEQLKFYIQTRDPLFLKEYKNRLTSSATGAQAQENIDATTGDLPGQIPAEIAPIIQGAAAPSNIATAALGAAGLGELSATTAAKAGLGAIARKAAIGAAGGATLLGAQAAAQQQLEHPEATADERKQAILGAVFAGGLLGAGGGALAARLGSKLRVDPRDIIDLRNASSSPQDFVQRLSTTARINPADVIDITAETVGEHVNNAPRLEGTVAPPEEPIAPQEVQQATEQARAARQAELEQAFRNDPSVANRIAVEQARAERQAQLEQAFPSVIRLPQGEAPAAPTPPTPTPTDIAAGQGAPIVPPQRPPEPPAAPLARKLPLPPLGPRSGAAGPLESLVAPKPTAPSLIRPATLGELGVSAPEKGGTIKPVEQMTPQEFVQAGNKTGTQWGAIYNAIKAGKPINAALHDEVVAGVPEGYTKDGDIYRPLDLNTPSNRATIDEIVAKADAATQAARGNQDVASFVNGIESHVGGIFDPAGAGLERVFRNPKLRDAASKLVDYQRDILRQKFGDSVPVYRAPSEAGKAPSNRSIFSWTLDKSIAEAHAKNSGGQIISRTVPVEAIEWVANPTEKEVLINNDKLNVIDKKPVNAQAVEQYGIKLPTGYVRQGGLYVYAPEAKAAKVPAPLPSLVPEKASLLAELKPTSKEPSSLVGPSGDVVKGRDFYITKRGDDGNIQWTPVKGSEVKIDAAPNYEFFVYKRPPTPSDKGGDWKVIEKSTGLGLDLQRATTRADAIAKTNEKITKLGERFDHIIGNARLQTPPHPESVAQPKPEETQNVPITRGVQPPNPESQLQGTPRGAAVPADSGEVRQAGRRPSGRGDSFAGGAEVQAPEVAAQPLRAAEPATAVLLREPKVRLTLPEQATGVLVTHESGLKKFYGESEFARGNILQDVPIRSVKPARLVGKTPEVVKGEVGAEAPQPPPPKPTGQRNPRTGSRFGTDNPQKGAVNLGNLPQDVADMVRRSARAMRALAADVDFRQAMEDVYNNAIHNSKLAEPYRKIIEDTHRNAAVHEDEARLVRQALDKAIGKNDRVRQQVADSLVDSTATARQIQHLPPEVRPLVEHVRDLIDTKTAQILDQLGPTLSQDLRDKLGENLGTYLRRSYRIFDDPDKQLKSITPAQFDSAVHRYQTDNGGSHQDAVEFVNKFIDRENLQHTQGFIQGTGKLAGKSVGTLIQRKDLPLEYRVLLGEYTDPVDKVYHTLQSQNNMLRNDAAQQAIVREGVARGDLRTTAHPFDVEFQPSAESGRKYDRYKGIYSTPDFRRPFFEKGGSFGSAADMVPMMLRVLHTVTQATKQAMVPLNPKTYFPQFDADFMMNLQQGRVTLDPRAHARGVVEAARTLGISNPNFITDAEAVKLRQYLVREGILSKSIVEGGLTPLRKGTNLLDYIPGYRKGSEKLGSLFSGTSNAAKVPGALVEVAAYKKALAFDHPQWTDEQLTDAAWRRAGEVMRGTSHYYENIPNVIKAAGNYVPGANFFPSFTYAVQRGTVNGIRFGLQDLRQGVRTKNPYLMRTGLRRLAFITAYYTAAVAAYSAWNAHYGNDKEQDAVKHFAGEYDKHEQLVLLGKPTADNIRYAPASYFDPNSSIAKAILDGIHASGLKDKLAIVGKDLLEPYTGDNPVFKAGAEAITNRDDRDRPIAYPQDSLPYLKRGAYFAKQTLTPGVVSFGQGLIRAAGTQSQSPSGTNTTLGDSAQQLLGLRVRDFSPTARLPFIARPLVNELNTIQQGLNSATHAKGATDADKQAAIQNATEAQRATMQKLYEMRDSFMALDGATQEKFVAQMKNAGFGNEKIGEILNGTPAESKPATTHDALDPQTVTHAVVAAVDQAVEQKQKRDNMQEFYDAWKAAKTVPERQAIFKNATADIIQSHDVKAAQQFNATFNRMKLNDQLSQMDKVLAGLDDRHRAVELGKLITEQDAANNNDPTAHHALLLELVQKKLLTPGVGRELAGMGFK